MRRLYVLRPEPGASATVEEAAGLGIDAVSIPLFAVEPLAWEVPDPGEFDALLLTSVNALRHGGEGLRSLRRLPVHAVGLATADAAREAGFEIASSGDSGIERLLGAIAPDLRLLHLCGQHRMDAEVARDIVRIPVYCAARLPAPTGFRRIEGGTVMIHSPRAGKRLSELADELAIDRSTVRVAAISRAAAEAAGGGWTMREAAERPDSATLLALAARLCDNPRRV